MKKLFLSSAILLAFSACNRPAERTAVVNAKVADKVFAISDLAEITGSNKAVIIKSASKDSITKMDASLKPVAAEGKIADLLKKVKLEGTKAALDSQLSTGAIAVVVLKDQIKIYKVMPADTAAPQPPADPANPPAGNPPSDNPGAPANPPSTPPAGFPPATNPPPAIAAPSDEASPLAESSVDSAAPQDLLTFNYLARLKALSKTSDAKAQSDIQGELDKAKAQRPSEAGETSGFVEITSIKVEKVGILDNERTDYGEKKSTLNVIDGPFDMATHILVGDEIDPSKKASDDGTEQNASDAQ